MRNKIIIAVLFISSGLILGIVITRSLNHESIQYAIWLGLFLLAAATYSLTRVYIVSQRKSLKRPEDKRQHTEVGFVVDTFQELVGKLKDKERELDRLRTLAEDRAVRMETYNENILQSVPSGVVSIDRSMKIKSINHSAESTLGLRAEHVIEKYCAEVFHDPLLSIMQDSRTVHRGEYPYMTRDGRHIWLGVTTSQLKNATGEALGLILVFTDLTDVKALQTQVELKKRLTQLGEMSAGIAHELRNPMSVIAGYARLLSRKIDETNKSTVSAILTEIEGMDRIISELLAFAKPTDLNKYPVNLNSIIGETTYAAVSGNRDVKVVVHAEKPFSVMGDEVLLRQVFTNLCVNAVDAMPEGGTLTIKVNDLNNATEIIIADTGHGMPEDIRQKIFLPFYTTKQKGIGLGLAIVQKIIVLHNGSIEVGSAEGGGTTFRIVLPAGTWTIR